MKATISTTSSPRPTTLWDVKDRAGIYRLSKVQKDGSGAFPSVNDVIYYIVPESQITSGFSSVKSLIRIGPGPKGHPTISLISQSPSIQTFLVEPVSSADIHVEC